MPVSAFENALTEGENPKGQGGRILWEEMLWLLEKLKTRNGKRVAIFNIRLLLESTGEGRGGTGGRARSSRERGVGLNQPETPPGWVT